MIPWLRPTDPFPPVEQALAEPNGLLAAGADLSPARLLTAYRLGIFPWFNPGEPILWWSPDPRMVLFPSEFRLSRSLRRRLRRRDYELRVDSAFTAVMQACAAPRPGQRGTWITPAMIAAYTRLHELGHAHSFETWIDGELVGGLYGVAIGRVFYGESMFARVSDASKIALAHLVAQLRAWGYGLIDCQMSTAHLASLGAREIPRAQFVRLLAQLTAQPGRAPPWTCAVGGPDGHAHPPATAVAGRAQGLVLETDSSDTP
ncbi:MAG: leucyl/phenylalanyl-tRNA--protein transferase [Thiobacillaceae bacterium]|nr:leucyl/phenylalanyl-tRNA--protein transferase [Thiobacillaceae bacterium]MCX7672354.1 leucyl/phenylalanyl-tRNA--protein transferase [Thiobacillaceae bacterium]MDW8322482.1 leucyl/phenylalanyl-tRNA--protein transferase [Burkholderiales bacterium]